MPQTEPASTVMPTTPWDKTEMIYTEVPATGVDVEPARFLRVAHKSSGHHYSVAVDAFDAAVHRELKSEDAVDADGRAFPPVYKTPAGESAGAAQSAASAADTKEN